MSGNGGAGGSTGGTTATATFGGIYAGNSVKCTTAACYTTNPSTSGCSCPAGFTASPPLDLLDDRSCPAGHEPYGWQSLYVCYAGSWSANADFGGYYHFDGTTCNAGNPFAGDACSCPSGTQAIEFLVDGSCWDDWHIGLCWNPNAPATTFAGAYETSDSTTQGNNGCVVANPATSACSCPSGSTATAVRSVYGPGNASCKSTGAVGGHVYVCSVP